MLFEAGFFKSGKADEAPPISSRQPTLN